MLSLKVVNKTTAITIFQSSNCSNRRVWLQTNLGKIVEQSIRLYLPLFQQVSIPASIATTSNRSDAPYEHARYQGWIIGVEYR